jgi:hypothetical protein
MLRVICVRTGTKYSQWYEDNLRYMVDKYSGLEYDEFVCIKDDVYDDARGVFNKLLMFDYFKDGQNIYFDLDTLIKGDCNHFLRKDFTLCHAHWRPAYHTPLNSSIVSWEGDASHVTKAFHDDPEWCLLYYRRGMDQYIFEKTDYKTFTEEDGYVSFQTEMEETDAPIYLFNQRYQDLLKENQWYTKYLLNTDDKPEFSELAQLTDTKLRKMWKTDNTPALLKANQASKIRTKK